MAFGVARGVQTPTPVPARPFLREAANVARSPCSEALLCELQGCRPPDWDQPLQSQRDLRRHCSLAGGAIAGALAFGHRHRHRPRGSVLQSTPVLRDFLVDPALDLAVCVLVGPHGMTDVEDARVTRRGMQVLCLTYSIVLSVAWLSYQLPCYMTSRFLLRAVFGVVSAYHLRDDLGKNFAWSIAVHTIALASVAFFGPMVPWRWTVIWLSFWHAPNHYARFFSAPDRNVRAGILLILVGVTTGFVAWKTHIFVAIPEWFVIGSVVSHAICTEVWRRSSK